MTGVNPAFGDPEQNVREQADAARLMEWVGWLFVSMQRAGAPVLHRISEHACDGPDGPIVHAGAYGCWASPRSVPVKGAADAAPATVFGDAAGILQRERHWEWMACRRVAANDFAAFTMKPRNPDAQPDENGWRRISTAISAYAAPLLLATSEDNCECEEGSA